MLNDWEVYRLAVRALLSGGNPYLVGAGEMRFFNPPWTLIPILPLTIFPHGIGMILNGVASLISFMLVARHLKMGIWGFFLLAISPMHIEALMYGNIEWLPMLGLLAPPPLALLIFTTKPQATIGLILLLLWQVWVKDKHKGILLTVAPTAVFLIITLWLWGVPPMPGSANPGQHSLFPYSLLLGIPALIWAIKKQDQKVAAFSGPFISPYVTFHGYLPALLPLRGWWLFAAVIIVYIPILINFFT